MKNKPLVSIIIRTKNEQNWIDSCLKSIFNQSYKKFESYDRNGIVNR